MDGDEFEVPLKRRQSVSSGSVDEGALNSEVQRQSVGSVLGVAAPPGTFGNQI